MSKHERESLPYKNELSASLLEAVEQVCNEAHSDAALERAVRRACQLEATVSKAEAERQDNSRARSVLPRTHFLSSTRRMHMIARIAAVVLAFVGITGALSWLAPDNAGIAFAQVQKALEEIRSVTFDVARKTPGEPEVKSRVLVLGGDRVRVEMPDGEYMVHDRKGSKTLLVRENDSSAVLILGRQPGTEDVPGDLYERLRAMHSKAVERLPERMIAGKATTGYRIEDSQQLLRLWTDPDTKLPVRIESTRRDSEGREIVEVASNFEFDGRLDPARLSTDPPAGFAVETRTVSQHKESPDGSKLVLTAKVGLGPAHFGMSKAAVIKALGPADVVSSNGSGGETLRYDSQGFWLGFGPDDTLRDIACHSHPETAAPVARTFSGATSEGVRIGASRNAIAKELGPPDFVDERQSPSGTVTTIGYWNLGLEFSLRDDSLNEIYASRPSGSK